MTFKFGYRTLLIAVILFSAFSWLLILRQPPKLELRQTSLKIDSAHKTIHVDLTKAIDAAGIDEWRVLHNATAGLEHVIILDVSGMSREVVGDGYCGGGIERNLIFLRLGSNLRVKEIKSYLIHSCYESISFDSKTETKKELSFKYFSLGGENTITFEKHQPLNGFQNTKG